MNIVEDGRQCNIYLYADDAKIYKSIVTDDDANSYKELSVGLRNGAILGY